MTEATEGAVPASPPRPVQVPIEAPAMVRGGTAAVPLAASGRILAVLYLGALAAAGLAAVRLDAGWGLAGHAAILIAIMVGAARLDFAADVGRSLPPAGRQARNFLVALALPPVVRIVSLALPLAERDPAIRYGAIAIPALVASLAAIRATGYRRRDVGLQIRWSRRGLPLDLLLGAAGIGLGYAAYRLLGPTPLVAEAPASLGAIFTLALPLVVAGFAEELVLRGVVLRAAGDLLGPVVGVVFVAALGAALSVGLGQPAAIVAAFVVGLAFGGAVWLTRSLLGVALAHGAATVGALILFPSALGPG